MWARPDVRASVESYRRLLVRVPEAYWLVRDYGATRPGVLLLDPSGARVAATSLQGEHVPALARELITLLEGGRTAPVAEDGWPPTVELAFGIRPATPSTRLGDVERWIATVPGVRSVRGDGDQLRVSVARLWADPDAIAIGAGFLGVALEPGVHRRLVVPVEAVPDTPSTLRDVTRVEREVPGVLNAVPDMDGRALRLLYRTDLLDADAVRAAVQARGYRLRDTR